MAITLITVGVPDPSETESLAAYGRSASQLIAEAGGRPVGRYRVTERIAGDRPAALVSVAEFPSREAATALFASDAYRDLLPLRERAFRSLDIYLGEPPA